MFRKYFACFELIFCSLQLFASQCISNRNSISLVDFLAVFKGIESRMIVLGRYHLSNFTQTKIMSMANFLVRCWLPRLDTYVSYQTAPNLARRTLEDIFGVRGICLETRKNAFRNLARGRWYVSLVLGKPQFNSRSWETPWDFPGKSRTCMFNSRSWETPWDLPGNSVCGVGFAFRIQERSACVSCFRCQDPMLQVHGR